jgi:hypothetical protein
MNNLIRLNMNDILDTNQPLTKHLTNGHYGTASSFNIERLEYEREREREEHVKTNKHTIVLFTRAKTNNEITDFSIIEIFFEPFE